MERIELLSPARDLETGIAAISAGADAVYLGASRFGAREAAGNALEDIEKLARYAHQYWARVYVTVNTLLYDHELAEAERLIDQLYQAGADALIIQDVGLLELDLPPLPLFASTQMHNHTPERIAFLEGVGFQRVILARELTLAQIREIRARTTLELESFIHGALCVSYSGQCYLSYAIGGRSGNRGQCAQPCRRVYDLVGRDGTSLPIGRYPLSLRDLNLSASLAELIEAGVCSFKIEGRLKDRAYVMNVVAHYRKLLDAELDHHAMRPAASGVIRFDFEPDPQKTFNRGFTSYFLHDREDEVAANHSPKSLGQPIGKVTAILPDGFRLEPSAPALRAGDGLCFFTPQHELAGSIVNRVEGHIITPASLAGLSVGAMVYRNHDHEFTERLKNSQVARKIRLQFHLQAAPAGLTLTASDEDGVQAAVSIATGLEPARQVERTRETIQRQLRKLGGTAFECSGVEIALEPLPFLPVGMINALRRDVIAALLQARAAALPRLTGGANRNAIPYPTDTLTFEGNVLNHLAAAFYRRHGVRSIEPAAESGLDLHGRKVMTTRYCLRYQLNACPRQPNPRKLPEPLRLVDEQGLEFPLRFNCAACVMEIYASEPQ